MLKILVSDDDFPIRDWLAKCCRDILLDENPDVETAANGQIAWDMFFEDPKDVMFVDIKMPVMDGLELIQKIREINERVYIVVLSSYDDFNYARKAYHNNVNEYVLKTEITNEYMINILERAKTFLNQHKDPENTEVFYSFDQIIDDINHIKSEDEKSKILKKYNIKVPSGTFFCVANYNKNKAFGSLKIIQEDNFYKLFSLRAENAEVTCFSISGEPSTLYQIQKMNIFIRKIADMNKTNIICCGRMSSDPKKLFERLTETLWGLNLRYYITDNVYFMDQYLDAIKNYHNLNDDVLNDYRKILYLKDKNNSVEVSQRIDSFFENIIKYKCLNVPLVKSMSIRIINELIDTNEMIDLNNKDEIFNTIKKAESIIDIKQIVRNAYIKNMDNKISIKAHSATIQKALKYIYDNYQALSGQTEVAEYVGLNTEYFSRLFKEETGVNFSIYLNDYRLDRAEKLLLTTDKKLYEIAEETGFSSLSYFSRKFKEKFNKTPFDYKK